MGTRGPLARRRDAVTAGGRPGPLTRLRRRLHDHWFAPASVRDLALVRILIVGSQLFLFLEPLRVHHRKAAIDAAAWMPLPSMKVLLLPFGWGARPEPEVLAALFTSAFVLVWISGIGALLGLWTRVSLALFALGNTFLEGYFYGNVHHASGLMIIALWILPLTPSGQALSLDSLRARRRVARRGGGGRGREAASEPYSPMARWPLRLMQWLFVLAYFSAFLSKLRNAGLEWFNGYTLAYYVTLDAVRNETPGLALARSVELMQALSVGAGLFEATFALAVLVPPLAWLYVLAGAAFHTVIFVVQRAPFFEFIVLYSVFIEPLRRHGPVAWLRAWRRRWERGRAMGRPAAEALDRGSGREPVA